MLEGVNLSHRPMGIQDLLRGFSGTWIQKARGQAEGRQQTSKHKQSGGGVCDAMLWRHGADKKQILDSTCSREAAQTSRCLGVLEPCRLKRRYKASETQETAASQE